MTALSANREVDRYIDQQYRTFQVGGAETIYKGGFVSVDSSGYAAPLAAAELFVGIAVAGIDNSAGSDGDLTVKCFTQGDFEHALSGAAITDIGAAVYATDDGTLTLTPTSNSFVGYLIDLVSSGVIIVRISPFQTPPA